MDIAHGRPWVHGYDCNRLGLQGAVIILPGLIVWHEMKSAKSAGFADAITSG